jgi:hypothetical protein
MQQYPVPPLPGVPVLHSSDESLWSGVSLPVQTNPKEFSVHVTVELV